MHLSCLFRRFGVHPHDAVLSIEGAVDVRILYTAMPVTDFYATMQSASLFQLWVCSAGYCTMSECA